MGQVEDWNLDFEEWVDSTLASDQGSFAEVGFPIDSPYIGELMGWSGAGAGIHRTNDAVSGDYAVVVHRWYNYINGRLSLGSCDLYQNQACKVNYTTPFQKVKGFYKYFVTDTSSTMGSNAVMDLVISGIANGSYYDTIACTTVHFEPQNEYIFFEAPIQYYFDDFQMDSLSLVFSSKGIALSTMPIHNFLFLDKITLELSTAVQNQNSETATVAIRPNPTKNRFMIDSNLEKSQFKSIILCDGFGQIIQTNLPLNEYIDVSMLPAGIFFIEILDRMQGKRMLKLLRP